MKRFFKYTWIIILGIPVFQTGTYYLIGEQRVMVDYLKHFDPLLFEVKDLLIVTQKELTTAQKERITSILNEEYNVVDFADNLGKVDFLLMDEDISIINLEMETELPYRIKIYESLRTQNYIEVWESQLVWIAGKWVLRERRCIGQT
jgi:hypothetical protein